MEDRRSRRESSELYAATKIEDSSKETKIYIYICIRIRIYLSTLRDERRGKSRDTIRGGSPRGFHEIDRAKEAAERGRHAEGFRIVHCIEDTPRILVSRLICATCPVHFVINGINRTTCRDDSRLVASSVVLRSMNRAKEGRRSRRRPRRGK